MTNKLVVDGVTLSDASSKLSVDGSPAKMHVDGVLVYDVVVIAAPNLSTSGAIPDGTSGAYYGTYTPTNTGGAATSWSISTLPAGMTFNTSTGQLSGTPTAIGSYTVTITATNAGGSSGFTDTFVVAAAVVAPNISTSVAFPAATNGVPYSWSPTNTGGAANSFTLASGVLPTGLTLNPSTGVISGTPTVDQTQAITVRATNEAGSGNKSGSITVTTVYTAQWSSSNPRNLTEITAPSGTTDASITFEPDGRWSSNANANFDTGGTWVLPAVAAVNGLFEMKVDQVVYTTGERKYTPGLGALGTWVAINGNKKIAIDAAPDTIGAWYVDVTIREIADTGNSFTVRVNLTSERA